MYEIYQLGSDLFEIHSSFYGEQAMRGTRLAILTYAVHTLGFKPMELEMALLDMIKRDHNAAHFGINKTFIYSFPKPEKKAS